MESAYAFAYTHVKFSWMLIGQHPTSLQAMQVDILVVFHLSSGYFNQNDTHLASTTVLAGDVYAPRPGATTTTTTGGNNANALQTATGTDGNYLVVQGLLGFPVNYTSISLRVCCCCLHAVRPPTVTLLNVRRFFVSLPQKRVACAALR
jgi:hypothetical protein